MVYSLCFATLGTCYRSSYDLFCVQVLVFPWTYYVCLLSCFSGVLAYQVHGFLYQGIGLSLALVVDSFQLFICGVDFLFPFVCSLFLGALLCRVSRRYVPAVAFWLSYVVLFFAVSVFPAVSFSNVCDRWKYFLIEYVYAVGSQGGEGSPGIFYCTEYVYLV